MIFLCECLVFCILCCEINQLNPKLRDTNKEYWNKGFATEASAASLKYGFEKLNLNEIYIHTYVKNIPSQKVAEKLSMKRIKEFEKFIKGYDIFMRHVVYSINIEEYREIKSAFDNYSISC